MKKLKGKKEKVITYLKGSVSCGVCEICGKMRIVLIKGMCLKCLRKIVTKLLPSGKETKQQSYKTIIPIEEVEEMKKGAFAHEENSGVEQVNVSGKIQNIPRSGRDPNFKWVDPR